MLLSNPSDEQLCKIEEFVFNHPNGNFYQSTKAYQLFKEIENYQPLFFIAEENGKIKGSLLAFVIRDGKGIKKFLSRRCIIWGGPVTNDSNVTKSLLNELISVVKSRAIYTEFRNLFDINNDIKVFEEKGFNYQEWYNIILDVSTTDDAKKLLNKTRRWEINKSLKTGAEILQVSSIDELKLVYDILLDLYKTKVKKPLPSFNFFLKLFESPDTKIFSIKYDGQIVGGTICPIYKDKIYEWYECSINSIKDVYVSSLATYAPIEYANLNNIKYFDFMGAGSPKEDYGVRNFKAQFGGELFNYGRFLIVHKSLLYKIGKFGIKLLASVK